MRAAAEYLTGKYPSALKAAEANDASGPNVSYYVRTWRAGGNVDAMVELMLDERPATQEKEVTEPAIFTFSDRGCLEGVVRLPSGTGYNNSGTNLDGYKLCFKWAVGEYLAAREKGDGKRKAAEGAGYRAVSDRLMACTGVFLSHSTIYRGVQEHLANGNNDSSVASPPRLGKVSPYPREAELHLVEWIRAMRGFKLSVFKSTVMSVANSQIAGTAFERHWPNGVTNNWYYRFLSSHGLDTGSYRPLEISRAQWTTSANMKTHYGVLEEVFLSAGVAVKNPDFDETKPYDEPIKIIHPNMIFSWDESKATLDMKQGGKSKAERVVLGGANDRGETIANQGGGEASIVCGSYADGHSIPPMSIFAAGSILPRWADGGPVSTKINPATGREYPGTYAFNDTGAMKEKLTTQFMEHNVFAAMDEPPPNVKPVGIGDGYGDHYNIETLDYLRAKPAELVLRPPHTSHASQGEDVVGFSVFKPALRKRKMEVLSEKVQQRKTARLTLDDYGSCVKGPAERAFSRERNLRSWDVIGVSPFTRRVYWDMKIEEEAAATAAGQSSAPTWNRESAVFPTNSSAGGGSVDGNNANDDDDGGVTTSDRSAHNRLTSADLWHVGAVTGDTAHALVKEKQDAQAAKEADKMARKQSKQQAASARLSTAAQESQAIIARLRSQGITMVNLTAAELAAKCSAKELESLLLSADPQAKKGNKPDMAARIVTYMVEITQTAAAAAATTTQTTTHPEAQVGSPCAPTPLPPPQAPGPGL